MTRKRNPLIEDALAGDSDQGADDAAALPVRLNRYSKAHHRAVDMADYARERGYVKEANALERCGHFLQFRDYYIVGKVRLHAADFCQRHLLCPFCAIRRSDKLVRAYLPKVKTLIESRPGLNAYHVIFTVKNGADLGERFRHLRASMARMTQARRNYLKGRGPHVEMAKACAVVGSYEFKRGKGDGLWHPHVHMVWLSDQPLDENKIREEWKDVTGDSFMCKVVPFYDSEDLISGFLEVFKYAVKFSDLPFEDNWHGYEVLKGRNLIFSLGEFRGIEVPPGLADEPLDDQPFIEIVYRFNRGLGYEVASISEPKGPQAPWTKQGRKPRPEPPRYAGPQTLQEFFVRGRFIRARRSPRPAAPPS